VTIARIVSVNASRPRSEDLGGWQNRTSIRKQAVLGEVAVRRLGLEGDQVADTKYHGGTYKALYAFAQEDLDHWAEQLGQPVPPGMFGENLTTAGIDVNEAEVGERWRIGSVLAEVVSVRIPCRVFQGWLGVNGFDDTAWVRRFTAHGRPGPYLRVLETGTLRAGDEVVVEHRPGHGVTVSTMFAALTTQRWLLPRLLEVPGIEPWARERAEAYVASGELVLSAE